MQRKNIRLLDESEISANINPLGGGIGG